MHTETASAVAVAVLSVAAAAAVVAAVVTGELTEESIAAILAAVPATIAAAAAAAVSVRTSNKVVAGAERAAAGLKDVEHQVNAQMTALKNELAGSRLANEEVKAALVTANLQIQTLLSKFGGAE